jgi:hypothetical protein
MPNVGHAIVSNGNLCLGEKQSWLSMISFSMEVCHTNICSYAFPVYHLFPLPKSYACMPYLARNTLFLKMKHNVHVIYMIQIEGRKHWIIPFKIFKTMGAR